MTFPLVSGDKVESTAPTGTDRWSSDLFVLHLSSDEKLLVIVGAAAFVALVLLIVICWVGEICPVYRCLHQNDEKTQSEKQPLSRSRKHAASTCSKYSSDYDNTDTNIFLNRKPDGASVHSKGRDSTYSSMSESGRLSPSGSLKNKFGSSADTFDAPDVNSTISYSVQYQTNGERQIGKLVVTVLEVHSLPSRTYSSACDPFVRLTLSRERRSIRGTRSEMVGEFLTRTQRHTKSPVFEQAFTVEVAKTELKELVLKLSVYDEDKYGSPTDLGYVSQAVRNLKRVLTSDSTQQLAQELTISTQTHGELFFSLSYLPTAHRLSVTLIRASDLNHSRVTASASKFCPYIRAFLLNGSGRLLKKKKTTPRNSDSSPTIDETLVFDMGQQTVESACLLLCVFHQLPDDEMHLSDEQGGESGELRSPVSRKDLCVGKVAVGKNVRGDVAVTHWLTMLQNPRKIVSQWHSLT